MGSRQFYQAGWVKCLAVLAIVLILVPIIMRPVLVKLLENGGFEQASIEAININWFTGVVAIEGVSLTREGEPKLSLGLLRVDFEWLGLLQGELSASSAEISDVKFAVIQRPDNVWEVLVPIALAGDEPKPEASEQVSLPKLGLTELLLRNIDVRIDTEYASGQLSVEKLALHRLSSWQNHLSAASLAAAWNGAPIVLELNARPFQSNPELQGDIHIEGIDLRALSGVLPKDVSDIAGRLNIDVAITLERDSHGVLSVDLSTDLAAAELGVNYRNLALNLAATRWVGDVSLELQQQSVSYQLTGDLGVDQLSLKDHKQSMDLLLFDALKLQALSIDQQQDISFEQLSITELSAVKAPQASHYWLNNKWLLLDQLALQVAVSQPSLTLAALTMKGAEYNLAVTKQGEINGLEALDAALQPLLDSTAEAPKGQGDSTQTLPLLVRLDQLSVEQSLVAFQDQRFKKPYNNQLHIDNFLLGQLDQEKPKQASPLQLDARLGEFSTINVNGELSPFTSPLSVALVGDILSLPLPEISPYAEAYLGYQLMTGHYDHHLDLSLANNSLDMKNKLKLRRLELKPVNKNSAEKMSEGLGVPLPLALNMLRDRKGVIDLSVPLKGGIDTFNIGIDDIIKTALIKALQTGSMSYLQLALQPYGAAILAADLLVDQVTTIRFDPVLFQPGSVDLALQAIPYVEKLQGMLREREGLSLSLCGRASMADQLQLNPDANDEMEEQLEEQLLDLATRRANTLKRQFVEAGIQGERLYVCKSAYDDNAVTGVVLSM